MESSGATPTDRDECGRLRGTTSWKAISSGQSVGSECRRHRPLERSCEEVDVLESFFAERWLMVSSNDRSARGAGGRTCLRRVGDDSNFMAGDGDGRSVGRLTSRELPEPGPPTAAPPRKEG